MQSASALRAHCHAEEAHDEVSGAGATLLSYRTGTHLPRPFASAQGDMGNSVMDYSLLAARPAGFERGPGLGHVVVHLLLKSFDGVEFQLVSQPTHEFEPHLVAIQVTLKLH